MNRLLKGMFIFAIACLFAASSLQAADLTYVYGGTTYNFNSSTNWGGTAPAAGDTTRVLVTTNFPVISSDTTVNNLLIGSGMPAVGSPPVYDIAATPGEVDITGGNTTVTTTLRIGGAANSISVLKMTGGTFTKTANGNSVRIGFTENTSYTGAVGRLDLSGGAVFNVQTNVISVGLSPGATGYVTMDNATANVNTQPGNTVTVIGRSGGTGHMTMTNGSVWTQTYQDFWVGSDSGSTGTLTMSGGSTMINPSFVIIGYSLGHGTLSINDTSSISTKRFYVGSGEAGTGGVGQATLGTLGGTDTASVNCTESVNIGFNNGAQGILTMNASTQVNAITSLNVGSVKAAKGTLTMNDSSSAFLVGGGGDLFVVGNGLGSNGSLEMNSNSSVTIGQGNMLVGTGFRTTTYDNSTTPPTLISAYANGGTGYLKMTGSSTFTHLNNGSGWNAFYIATHAGAVGTVDMSGGTASTPGATMNLGVGGIAIGTDGGNGTLLMSEYSTVNLNTLDIGGGGELLRDPVAGDSIMKGVGTVNMSGHAAINVAQGVRLGTSNSVATGTGSIVMNDDSTIFAATSLSISSSDSSVNMNTRSSLTTIQNLVLSASGASFTMNDNSSASVKALQADNGSVTLNGHASLTATNDLSPGSYHSSGTMTLNDSAQVAGDSMTVGSYGAVYSVVVNNTALAAIAGNIQVGFNWGDTVDDMGTVSFTVNGTGIGPHVTAGGAIIVGADGGGGTWNQVGGKTVSTLPIILGQGDYSDSLAYQVGAHSSAVLNLKGGIFNAPSLTTQSAVLSTNGDDFGATRIHPVVATVNFDGGTLQASTTSSDFIAVDDPAATLTLKVLEGGAKLDTQGFDVTITKELASGIVGPAIDGGLEKIGSGRLILTGPISYTGPTVIDAGKLIINNSLTTNLSTISGATGTLEVLGTSVLNATSINCNTLQIGGAMTAAAVPEPSTLILLVLGGVGLLFQAWCKARA